MRLSNIELRGRSRLRKVLTLSTSPTQPEETGGSTSGGSTILTYTDDQSIPGYPYISTDRALGTFDSDTESFIIFSYSYPEKIQSFSLLEGALPSGWIFNPNDGSFGGTTNLETTTEYWVRIGLTTFDGVVIRRWFNFTVNATKQLKWVTDPELGEAEAGGSHQSILFAKKD